MSDKRHCSVSAAELADKWDIGIDAAKQTLKVMTQLGIRHALHPLRRRYRTDYMSLRYNRLDTTFYTDTLFSKSVSLNMNNCAQIFTNGKYVRVFPMTSKANAGAALQALAEDIGIPNRLVSDGAKEMTKENTLFIKTCRHLRIAHRTTEPHSPWQNLAENKIGEVKR
jgi:hypothetical protein